MKRVWFAVWRYTRWPVFSLCVVWLLMVAAVGTSPVLQRLDHETQRMTFNASKSIVQIEVGRYTGAGFVWGEQGILVTAAHMFSNSGSFGPPSVAMEGRVKTWDGEWWPVKLIAINEASDVAVMRVEAWRFLMFPKALPYPMLPRAKENPPVGALAFSVGSPFAYEKVITQGITSIVTDRPILRHTANINPGNSGGPLLNSKGELIGMNIQFTTAGWIGGAGVGMAVPIEELERIVPQLLLESHPMEPHECESP